jgi:hypothetical protein
MTELTQYAPSFSLTYGINAFASSHVPLNGLSKNEGCPSIVEKCPVELLDVEKLPVERCPVERCPVEQSPVEKSPVEKLPVEQSPVEQSPVKKSPVDVFFCSVMISPLSLNPEHKS